MKHKILDYSRRLYISIARFRVSKFPYHSKGNEILRSLKICLVKQETYNDLYSDPSQRNLNLLFSTVHRSGPIGLFPAHEFDFKIMRLSESEESLVWQHLEKDVGGDSFHKILSFKDMLFEKKSGAVINKSPQASVAQKAEDINWNNYDITISINFSVDRNVVLSNPDTLWCYMPQEPSLRHYKWSSKRPLYSYDIFLNQQFSFHLKKEIKRVFSFGRIASHEVDFPYNFMSSNSFHELEAIAPPQRSGVYIENHSFWHLSEVELRNLRRFGDISHPKEEPYQAILLKMLASKYFFSFRKNDFKIWGNSMIDAVGAGLLSFGNPDEYLNIGLFTPFTCVKTTDEFINKIEFLEKNPSFFLREVTLQRRLLDKYCFYNPIKSIHNAMELKRNRIGGTSIKSTGH